MEDLDIPGQQPSTLEELCEDTVLMRQDPKQASEDIYDDTAITHPGGGGGAVVKARALFDYQAG